jgi:hypothetical protein
MGGDFLARFYFGEDLANLAKKYIMKAENMIFKLNVCELIRG